MNIPPYRFEDQPDQTSVDTVNFGGFWIRLLAKLIDIAILTSAISIVIAIIPGYSLDTESAVLNWGVIIVAALYEVISVWLFSTTVGKRILKLYVQRTDGSRLGLGRAFARYFAGQLSYLILCIGHIMIGLSDEKRGLHDRICDTRVIKR